MRPEHVKHFLDLSLKRILLGYVDLYLIHMPIGFQYVSDDDTFPTEDGVAKMDHSTDLVKIWQVKFVFSCSNPLLIIRVGWQLRNVAPPCSIRRRSDFP